MAADRHRTTQIKLLHGVTLLLLLGVGHGWWAGCVDPLPIEGASCPCPRGYFCCETSGTCMKDNQAHQCPESYPPSSKIACLLNEQCPFSEVCESWSLEPEGALHGPQVCRKTCLPWEIPCDPQEICAVVPHDGRDLQHIHIHWACVEERPQLDDCSGIVCTACSPDHLGQAFCKGSELHACFMALHPRCGVTCRSMLLEQCGEHRCISSSTGAWCFDPSVLSSPPRQFQCVPGPQGSPWCGEPPTSPHPSSADWCTQFPCERCNMATPSGDFFCDEDANNLVACVRLPMTEDHLCQELCLQEIIQHCPNGCGIANPGAMPACL